MVGIPKLLKQLWGGKPRNEPTSRNPLVSIIAGGLYQRPVWTILINYTWTIHFAKLWPSSWNSNSYCIAALRNYLRFKKIWSFQFPLPHCSRCDSKCPGWSATQLSGSNWGGPTNRMNHLKSIEGKIQPQKCCKIEPQQSMFPRYYCRFTNFPMLQTVQQKRPTMIAVFYYTSMVISSDIPWYISIERSSRNCLNLKTQKTHKNNNRRLYFSFAALQNERTGILQREDFVGTNMVQ